MADRQKPNDNGDNPDGDDGSGSDLLKGLLLGIGGLAIAGGAIYAASRAFSGNAEEEEEERRPCSSFTNAPVEARWSRMSPESHIITVNPPNGTITIAVDATPTRGGGLLVLPCMRQVYFYSIDWSNIVKFGSDLGSDKFEMMNAYLALRIFAGYIAIYARETDMVVLKTDSTFCQSPSTAYSGSKNEHWRNIFRKVQSELQSEPIRGDWDYIPNGKRLDNFIRMADKLSRADCSNSQNLPGMEVLTNVDNRFLYYASENVSLGHEAFLTEVATMLPK